MPTASSDYFRYLPVSPADRHWGLYVTTAGRARIAPGFSCYPPTGHPQPYTFSWAQGRILQEYQVVFIASGSGTFESPPGARRRVQAGGAMLLFPGVWHRYTPSRQTGWEEYWVGFAGDYADRLVRKRFFSNRMPLFHCAADPLLVELFQQLLQAVSRQELGYQAVAAAMVHQILAHLHTSTLAASAGGSATAEIIRQARTALAGRVDQTVDMEELADALHVGYSWFRRMFRHYTGLSPHQYHLQLRIHAARQLLAGTDCTIKQVAAAVGFDSPYYFSRLFKKKVGTSPESWRRRSTGHGKRRTPHPQR